MFSLTGKDRALEEMRIRHGISMRIALAVTLFFSAAWCLLQWTLATEPRFMVEGLTRAFVVFEATACAVIAAFAFLHMAASGFGWAATVVRMRRLHAAAPRRTMKHTVRTA